MPLIIPKTLPAYDALYEENVFVMHRERAASQHIRPLEILILNLMPTKIATETQIARLLANTPLQVHMTLLQTMSHEATHVSAAHLEAFYKTFDEVKHNRYDGMIITGAPVETMDFEQVDYWPELCEIMDFSETNVYSTLHVCWGAQAGLYYHYGIRKELLLPLLCGIFLVEAVSTMVQVSYFRYTKHRYGEGRRYFLMAPLHHHYQKKGIPENKIVVRFWIVQILLAAMTLVTLKIR